MIVRVLIGILLFAPSAWAIQERTWSALDGKFLELADGGDERCAAGVLRAKKESGRWRVQLGTELRITFVDDGREAEFKGRVDGCRHVVQQSGTGLGFTRRGTYEECPNPEQDFEMTESVSIQDDILKYEKRVESHGRVLKAYECRFKVVDPPKPSHAGKRAAADLTRELGPQLEKVTRLVTPQTCVKD